MEPKTCTHEMAEAANHRFEQKIRVFLLNWIRRHEDKMLLRFDQPLDIYLSNDALRDFFLNTHHPFQKLLHHCSIAHHLGRKVKAVYFDPITGDPLLAPTEQRIYNLARRMDSDQMDIPFRSVHPNKQTEAGDIADIATYPVGSEHIRYNSGNHFTSRPANGSVFDENSRRCISRSGGNLTVLFKRGYLEDRLHEVKELTAVLREIGENRSHFFVICSRHSAKEGHFGVSLVIMDPAKPDFPDRVMVCDTLVKDLPQHPRWWPFFIEEYAQVFGDAIKEIVEDTSHPLQKVNIKGDNPYRHDWDCPYYAACMAVAMSDLVQDNPALLLNGIIENIHQAMKVRMPDYYHPDGTIRDRQEIQKVNRLKRWKSGRTVIKNLVTEIRLRSSYEL